MENDARAHQVGCDYFQHSISIATAMLPFGWLGTAEPLPAECWHERQRARMASDVQITDRSKDVIKSGGEWISSVDLENAIMGHPAVKEAAVIALPHTKWDERPLACIVLKDGESLTKAELDRHLLSDFAKWQLPDDLVMIDEVPKTSTGKFQKLTLRSRFADWQWGADQRMAG